MRPTQEAVRRNDPTPDAGATLAGWLAEEAGIRERLASQRPGLATYQQVAGRNGLDVLQAIFRGELPPPPISATLDFLLIDVQPGLAIFQGQPRFEHYNPLGSVHGGWICTLLDSAVGCAIHTQVPAGKGYTTIELKVNMVRALTDRVERVRAEGRVIHGGSQVATAEGRLIGPDGRLYAHATTTCLIFEARPPAAV